MSSALSRPRDTRGRFRRERHHADPQEDPYAISKAVCELQAEALCRYYPGLRIASLRFHMVKPDYASAVQDTRPDDAFAWVSLDASASACLRGVLSEGWEGAEAFNIAAPEICWEGGLTPESKSDVPLDGKKGAVELMQSMWAGRVDGWDEAYWEGRPRRSTFSSVKAERMLGWDHDSAADADL
jgi:nucleoside-diphosphate-sugar epimerase